jgi:allophanate hydrolase
MYAISVRGPPEVAESMLQPRDSLDLETLGRRLRAGELRPRDVVAGILQRVTARGDDKVWIHRTPREALEARADALEHRGPDGLPLYGIPFAVKDNIDAAGHPTTAGCPSYAYNPAEPAPVVRKLVDAGAILIGKTNLDQFATGLVGTRSPYGAVANAFDARYVSGGSSSGSAVAVAAGLASFSLGTDTAGSGRVPAAFNNIVGLKPTRGALSTRGVVPACRSLDCVSIFALTAGDADAVFAVARGFDADDPYSRRAGPVFPIPEAIAVCQFGVPRRNQLEFFGNREAERLFHAAVAELERLGGQRVEIDFTPFLETARLLYGGPWVAERYVAIREFFDRHPDAVFPVTREIIGGAAKFSAADAFTAQYRLEELRRESELVWEAIDMLVTPTAGTIYTIAEVNADPIRLNTNLGTYTNFMNLLDLSAIAVPAGFQADGLPFGITFAAPAFCDEALCVLGDAIHRRLVQRLGATDASFPPEPAARGDRARPEVVRLAVCGAHMSGLPLNHQLIERGARLARRCRTAPRYRLFALEAFTPPRPGLVRSGEAGQAIEVEVWSVPTETVGSFVDGIPAPLGIGTVELEDGELVRGFLCETYAVAGAEDISRLGSWRSYVTAKKGP